MSSNKFVESIGDINNTTPFKKTNFQLSRPKFNHVATEGNGIALTLPERKKDS